MRFIALTFLYLKFLDKYNDHTHLECFACKNLFPNRLNNMNLGKLQ